jgi:iron complex transport system ATP-binding protein
VPDPIIDVRDLSVDLGGKRILDGISFGVEEGSFHAVVGPNGSGKTTLIRSLYRAIDRASGTIRIDGAPIETFDRRALARTIAVLRQEPDLAFDFLVEELVMMGRSPYKNLFDPDREEDREIVRRALELTDVADLGRRNFTTLSGGERQRVLLARALAQRPRILLLDEPTNHLDIRHQLDVLRRVRELGLTVLAALHDLNLADRFATSVLLLDRGRAVAEGPPEVVLTPERIRQIFGVSALRLAHERGGVLAFLEADR